MKQGSNLEAKAAKTTAAKKPWIRPAAEAMPARRAEITCCGSGDGTACHS